MLLDKFNTFNGKGSYASGVKWPWNGNNNPVDTDEKTENNQLNKKEQESLVQLFN